MADEIPSIEDVHWKSLKKISDIHLKERGRENNGQVYSTILRDLQIRPEEYERFFEGNIRHFRNKKDNTELFAKGDDESLLNISKKYLTAYGKIGWEKHRKWLLPLNELNEDEEPLQYIVPRYRKEGDHDRFYEILGKLWKLMRNVIFEVKLPTSRQQSVHISEASESRRTSGRSLTAFTSSDMSSRSSRAYLEAQQQEEQTTELIPIDDQLATSERWSTSRTEQAIIKIIDDADWARDNSRSEVFEELWTRNLARLSEIEQAQAQNMQSAVYRQSSSNLEDYGHDEGLARVESTTIGLEFTDKKTVVDKSTNTDTNVSYSDQFPAGVPPSFPMTAYLPPTLPQIMTVYISPFSYTARGGQPYIWPDAPVHPTSYPAFLNGIRLRANVPERVRPERLMMVFAYGWNDFCCVVRNQEAWHKWFMNDLRNAAIKGGVGVWRMKVCCLAV